MRLLWCLSPHPRRRPQLPVCRTSCWDPQDAGVGEASHTFPTVRCRKRGSRGPSARGFVVGPQARGARGTPGLSPGRDRHTDTPAQMVAGPPARRLRRRRAPARRAPGPAAPLPSRAPSRASARTPGRAAALRTPTHSLRAQPPGLRLLRPLRALAGRQQLPLLAPGSAPGVFPGPALPCTPLPQVPPDSAPRGRRGAWPLGARRQVPAGGSAGDGWGTGAEGWRGRRRRGEERGRGAGEATGSVMQIVGPTGWVPGFTVPQTPWRGPPGVSSKRASG